MQIKNVPPQYLSRLDTIQLVAACKSINLKQTFTNMDNILELIVSDLKKLEMDGINISSNHNLRGALINVAYDNLGDNGLFGLTESFRWSYFCRHCECNKEECETNTAEDVSKLRTKIDYDRYMDIIQGSDGKIDLNETKGFQTHCLLNNLSFFHILENNSVDLMHDCNEGILPLLLETLFGYVINKNIATKRKIIVLVRDFNYGHLRKQEKPSPISFERVHLGQSACQMYFLFIHIPFILISFKEELDDVWIAIESMLKIMQIIYSKEIPENEVSRLEGLITLHMSKAKELLGVKFIPKYHFLLHYPNVIRRMGPPTTMWMTRFESKHKVLTDIAKKTNNFVNLPKTLALRYQGIVSAPSEIYVDRIERAKLTTSLTRSANFLKYNDIFSLPDVLLNFENAVIIKYVDFNGFEYRSGLLMVIDGSVFEVLDVLLNKEEYYLILASYRVLKYNKFCCSYIIEKNQGASYIWKKLDCSTNKKTFTKTICANEINLIANSLDISFNVD